MATTYTDEHGIVSILEPVDCTLYNYIHDQGERLNMQGIIQIGIKLADALKYCHMRGYIHGAISSHCVYFASDRNVKLGGWELARETANVRRQTNKLSSYTIIISNFFLQRKNRRYIFMFYFLNNEDDYSHVSRDDFMCYLKPIFDWKKFCWQNRLKKKKTDRVISVIPWHTRERFTNGNSRHCFRQNVRFWTNSLYRIDANRAPAVWNAEL